MTKKDYIAIAAVFAAHHLDGDGDQLRDAIRRDLATAFAQLLAQDNPRFDRDRFFAACKVAA